MEPEELLTIAERIRAVLDEYYLGNDVTVDTNTNRIYIHHFDKEPDIFEYVEEAGDWSFSGSGLTFDYIFDIYSCLTDSDVVILENSDENNN